VPGCAKGFEDRVPAQCRATLSNSQHFLPRFVWLYLFGTRVQSIDKSVVKQSAARGN
jgi:hypothetical protein